MSKRYCASAAHGLISRQDVDWIPADLAAGAILDFCKYPGPAHIVHLTHPRPVSWRSVAASIAEEFSVPLVPYSEWFAKLEEHCTQSGLRLAVAPLPDDVLRGQHALRLMPFYRNVAERVNSASHALGMVKLDLTEALKASPTLADPDLRQLRVQDAQRWIAYWRKTGMFS